MTWIDGFSRDYYFAKNCSRNNNVARSPTALLITDYIPLNPVKENKAKIEPEMSQSKGDLSQKKEKVDQITHFLTT